MTLIASELEVAGLEHAATDPTDFLFAGRLYYNSSSKKIFKYDGSAWVNINSFLGAYPSIAGIKAITAAERAEGDVALLRRNSAPGLGDNDTSHSWWSFDADSSLTGDDLLTIQPDAGSGRWLRIHQDPIVRVTQFVEQSTKPNAPDAGTNHVYFKDDGKFYFQNSSGAEQEIGSGSGGGSINYIENHDFEADNTDGWATYDDGASAVPVDGTGGSPSAVTLGIGTGSLIRGTFNMNVIKSAADGQGEGASYDITLDAADKNKQLEITFDFDSSGTYNAGDVAVYVVDDTGGTPALITPNLTPVPEGSGQFRTTFVTSDQTDIRLCFHVTSTNASSYTLHVDNIRVGPVQGTAIYPMEDLIKDDTISIDGFTGTVDQDIWRARRGDTMIIRGWISSSTKSATTSVLNLPSGYTADATKLSDNDQVQIMGKWVRIRAASEIQISTNDLEGYFVWDQNISRIALVRRSGSGVLPLDNTDAMFAGATDEISFYLEVPIAEWANSNAQVNNSIVEYAYNSSTNLSSDDTSSFGYGPGGFEIGAITAELVRRVQFQNAIQSTDRIWVEISEDGVNRWTDIASWAQPGGFQVNAYSRQGSTSYGFGKIEIVTDKLVDITFGQYRDASSGTYAAAGSSWSGAAASAHWRVVKASNPIGIVSGDARILARYEMSGSSATTSIANSSTLVIDLDTKIFDTHNAVSTGSSWAFTCPRAGYYRVSLRTQLSDYTAWGSGEQIQTKITAGGVTVEAGVTVGSNSSGGAANGQLTLIEIFNLAQGDTIEPKIFQNSGVTQNYILDSRNTITIEEISSVIHR